MAVDVPEKLRRKVDELPRQPGVYLMKSAENEVIYVGKAKDLRARVRSYFQRGRDESRLISEQIDQVADVDVVVTGTEAEALLLESNFIKQFAPKYNVLFRDDKSFVSIKIDTSEPFPRPVITRRVDDEDAVYFGPYANAQAARQTLRTLLDLFPLRRCKIEECMQRQRPCLYGEMGKCAAPCCSDTTQEEYGELIQQVIDFLKGGSANLVERMQQEMAQAAAERDYEKAASIRDRIESILETVERQRVASTEEDVDRDVFGLCTTEPYVAIAVLFGRDGNVQDVATYRFNARLDSEQAIFRSFLNQFYTANRYIPDEVLVPVPTEDAELLEQWLSEQKGRRVRIHHPRRGRKRSLVELANRNALQAERAATTRAERCRIEMESLEQVLGLGRLPRIIECFDISTLHGREAVGSMVVFRDGRPDKSSYRRYKIREVEGMDDFAMMREVLTRRYRKIAENNEARPPDLVLVDGGKGQLGVAQAVLWELQVTECDLAALAKARSSGGQQTKGERVFLPGRRDPLPVPRDSYAHRLVTRVRDEAHRFAISYHRKLRRRRAMESPLQEIPGIGRAKARRLEEHFGGLNKVRRATQEELTAVRGISDKLADAIVEHFRDGG